MRDIDDKALDAPCEQAIGFCEDVRQRANKSENEEIKYDAGDKHLDYEAARAFSDLAAAIMGIRARLAEAERERDEANERLSAKAKLLQNALAAGASALRRENEAEARADAATAQAAKMREAVKEAALTLESIGMLDLPQVATSIANKAAERARDAMKEDGK